MTTNINPDLLYLKTREDLLLYEDARFNSLIRAMANFYTVRNDQSQFGNNLRALAMELAKFEYFYSYDLVNRQPQYLTPPDIKRRWAAPLFINRNYPTNSQSDLQYRTMLVNLLAAYREGATVKCIEDVITAYTGLKITVVELFKLIGTFYDVSYRNTLSVGVRISDVDNLKSDIQNLIQLQQTTATLYGALDLAKPAHVGIDFSLIFEEGDLIDGYVIDVSLSPNGISDVLRIFFQLIEAEPQDPMLIQAPILDPMNPKTTVSAYGQVFLPVLSIESWNALVEPNLPSWDSGHTYSVGDQILDSNWNIQTVVIPGTSGSTEPNWTKVLFGTTSDNNADSPAEPDDLITWELTAPTAKAAYTFSSVSNMYNINYYAKSWIMLVEDSGSPGIPIPTGYLANYDPSMPNGLVAPRLNRAWEISSDQVYIFEE